MSAPLSPPRPNEACDAAGAPLLDVRNLSVVFHQNGEDTLVVRDVSFQLRRGRTLALVGESGSGKSVTALSIVRLLAENASHPQGEIRFDDKDLLSASDKNIRALRGDDITMVFQEPMTSLNPLHTIERQINEILVQHGQNDPTKNRKRVLEVLNQVGIRNAEDRLGAYPHQLSGGQRQRVMIAMALANCPRLLIADEPTTALDVTVQAQILHLLDELRRSMHMAMLFITHDLGVVRKIADDVCVMQKGEIVEAGPVAEIFARPQHPYTRQLLAAEMEEPPLPCDGKAAKIVETDKLRVWFPIKTGLFRRVCGHVKAVDGVSLEVREGRTVGVVGESGSGKTTLGLAILRLIPSEGPIVFMGQNINECRRRDMAPLRRNMQIVFQDPYGSLSPRMSVAEIVAEGLTVSRKNLSMTEQREIVAAALEETGIDPKNMDRYPHEFSGGQRQRIAIARALALSPKFIVLDEPTSALDKTVQARIVKLLRDLQDRRGFAYLFISHDLKVVRALAHHVVVMRNGVVVEHGPAQKIFNAPENNYTRALFAAAFDIAPMEKEASIVKP